MAEITERCGCGAQITVKTAWFDHPSYTMIMRWRASHGCPYRFPVPDQGAVQNSRLEAAISQIHGSPR